MSPMADSIEQYFRSAELDDDDLMHVLDAVARYFRVPVTVMAPRPVALTPSRG